jgi:hypothetical protein
MGNLTVFTDQSCFISGRALGPQREEAMINLAISGTV